LGVHGGTFTVQGERAVDPTSWKQPPPPQLLALAEGNR